MAVQILINKLFKYQQYQMKNEKRGGQKNVGVNNEVQRLQLLMNMTKQTLAASLLQ